MNVQPTVDLNRAAHLFAEQTRRTILHYRAEIERLEGVLAATLDLAEADVPSADAGILTIAAKFAPKTEQQEFASQIGAG